jgi:dihydrofolate reductase
MPAKLIYTAIMSLDGYINDATGNFDWAAPDEEVHGFVNDLERPIGTHLYGRRMYETMRYWETAHTIQPDVYSEYTDIWQAAEKVVYSTSLDAVSTSRTRLERVFDPAAIRALKLGAQRDISIGGPTLAAHAFGAGLVDECHLLVTPVAVGGGQPALPHSMRIDLELLDERRFRNGVVHLHHAVRR